MSSDHVKNGGYSDYVIIGGGLCGCVLASRLSQKHSVTLIEAGALPDDHPLIGPPAACFLANRTELDWNYTTIPQSHLDGKRCYASGGKVLSGGTAINRGTWSIGSSADYDEWARIVGDDRYTFDKMQKYLGRTQIHSEKVSCTRKYPLREATKAMLDQAGIPFSASSNSGSILGYEEYEENWKNARRQLASKAYDLSNVQVMHTTLVARIIVDEESGKAIGVETSTGEQILARKEVILSAGAYRTPQILMLSGIGRKEELDKHNIPLLVESPHVGTNFHDHLCSFLWWHVRNPEFGVAAGSAAFNTNKTYAAGLPADWIMWQRCADDAALRQALQEDAYDMERDPHALLHPKRAHVEIVFWYSAPGGIPANVALPTDGTVLGQSIFLASPSSRGLITLKTKDPKDNPEVDPNYYSTKSDRVILESAMRQVHQLLSGPAGQTIVSTEYLPPGLEECNTDSSEHIEARIKRVGGTLYHAGGSASMGKVVDSDFRVIGVPNLRIVDASVVPIPLAGHSQACLYAMAELAADVIGEA